MRSRTPRYKDGGAVQDDEASKAFQKQIDALRQSEEIQRQQQALAAQHGLTANQIKFITHNPSFVHHDEPARRALQAAHAEGHPEDSDQFHQAVHDHFHREIGRHHSHDLVERGGMRPPLTIPDDEPAKPKRKVSMDIDDDDLTPSRFCSAPVSRECTTTALGGHNGERPGRITLSAEQVDMARRLGMSVKEYADGLLAMRQTDKEYNR